MGKCVSLCQDIPIVVVNCSAVLYPHIAAFSARVTTNGNIYLTSRRK